MPRAHERLTTYRAKRRFDRTPEPSGQRSARRARGPRYVIQKHAARRLHYDFRLEHDGVLLSWSVPKGPSLAPTERRLAVRTEDHPLDYADFEGIIPQGEYGGGSVIVWDQGSWEPEGDDVEEAVQRGRLTFTLHGKKLHGRWHLVRTRGRDGDKDNWLLFKGRDEHADDARDIVGEEPASVISGRTIEDVGGAPDRVWHSNRRADDRFTRQRDARKQATARRRGDGDGDGGDLTGVYAELQRLGTTLGVGLTNLDKVLFPEQGLTKGQLVAYHAVVADWMLPHIARRPLTLVRCPEGRHKHCFYQKHVFPGVPEVIRRIDIAEKDGSGVYMYVDDLAGLIGLSQLGVLEIHPWGCHVDKVERPDQLILDIDPDPAVPWEMVAETALILRQRLGDLGLTSFLKTTGGKGLHVLAPIERRLDWDELKEFSMGIVAQLAAERPERYVINMAKAARKGKMYLDYLRNDRGSTAVGPYSVRAREGAPVATPLTWEELAGGARPADFNVLTVPPRLAALKRDPWADYGAVRQSITAAMQRKVSAGRRRR